MSSADAVLDAGSIRSERQLQASPGPARMLAWLGAAPPGTAWAAWFDGESGESWVARGVMSASCSPAPRSCELAGSAPAALVSERFDLVRPSFTPWEAWAQRLELVLVEGLIEGRDGARAFVQALVDEAPMRLDQLARAAELPAPRTTTATTAATTTTATPRRELEPRGAFEARVREATRAIERGELEKVVLARAVELTIDDGAWDPLATVASLLARAPRAVVFALSPGGDAGVFVGATPETLVRVREGGRVEAVALAGTARPEEAALLLGRDKERREHALVVDALHRGLAPSCRLLDVPAAPVVRSLPGLCHLETRLRGVLARPTSVLELARRLHPTPALAGAPREAALAWLRATEPLDRGRFGAPLGWVDAAGRGTAVVGIRSALLRGRSAWAFAGCGVVAGSCPAAEWEETALKLGTIEGGLVATTRNGGIA